MQQSWETQDLPSREWRYEGLSYPRLSECRDIRLLGRHLDACLIAWVSAVRQEIGPVSLEGGQKGHTCYELSSDIWLRRWMSALPRGDPPPCRDTSVNSRAGPTQRLERRSM
jgi:hypothetical protein